MTSIRLLTFGVSALALVACASKGAAPPEVAYDSEEFLPAMAEPEPGRAVEIVTVPKPLPLPGQLKPLPSGAPRKPDNRPPAERIDEANKAARQEPSRDGYVDAMQVYAYSPGALYQVYAAPEQISDITLQPGEKLIAVSAGDTVRWVVGDTTSGTGENEQTRILVKPIAPALKTNLVIATDRRTYHLELESTDRTYMAAISWHYPHDRLIALQRKNEEVAHASGQAIDTGLSLDRLRFRYEISGDNPPWRPLYAFDDTSKVYIEFPRRIDLGEAPPDVAMAEPQGAGQARPRPGARSQLSEPEAGILESKGRPRGLQPALAAGSGLAVPGHGG